MKKSLMFFAIVALLTSCQRDKSGENSANENDKQNNIAAVSSSSSRTFAKPSPRQMIDLYWSLNEKCRGGSGDSPATLAYCDKRDSLSNELKGAGWCLDSATGWSGDEAWRECKAASVHQSIIGEWTELDRKCAVGPFGDGNGDGVGDDIANMEIRADGYGGYEWGCDLKPKVGAASTYNGKSICYSEGEASPPARISFEIMADGKLKMTTPEGKTVMKRCK